MYASDLDTFNHTDFEREQIAALPARVDPESIPHHKRPDAPVWLGLGRDDTGRYTGDRQQFDPIELGGEAALISRLQMLQAEFADYKRRYILNPKEDIMRKMDELTKADSCMGRALNNEMTFVLLGRDEAAPDVIRTWISKRIELGKNKPGDIQILEAEECARIMEAERSAIRFAIADRIM